MLMVKARKNGFYDGIYRYVGDRFSIASEAKFSLHWMEKLTKDETKKAEGQAKADVAAAAKIKAEHKKNSDDRQAARLADRESQEVRRKEVEAIRVSNARTKSNK